MELFRKFLTGRETKLEQIENFNPYRRVEAETMAWGYGLKAENHKNGGLYITDIDDNEYLCVRGVDFGKKGAKKFSVSAACVEKRRNDRNSSGQH